METINLPVENAVPHNRHYAVLAGLLVLCALAIGYGTYWLRYCPLSAIEAEDVASMQLTIQGRLLGTEEKIALKRRAFADVLSALKPCRRDWSGIKWATIGSLEIVLKNGKKHHLCLYETQQEETAFDIDGWSYLGGSEKMLNQLLVRESVRDAINNIGILKKLDL